MVNLRVLAGVALLILSTLLPLPVSAADKEETMKEDRFVITPRIWVGNFTSPKIQDQVSEEISLPMFGATLS